MYIRLRCTAAGREIAAYLCRMWTGEPLSRISERFGLSRGIGFQPVVVLTDAARLATLAAYPTLNFMATV